MARAAVNQTSFLGGEWSPYAYGRSDNPMYSTALTTSLNGFPIEEGAWMKRSGSEFIVPTYQGNYANILPFDGSETCSFAMEFTSPPGAGHGILRLLTQSSLVFTNDARKVVSVNTTTQVITLDANSGWSSGDQVMFVFPDVTSPYYPYAISDELGLRNQVVTIENVSTDVLQLSGGDSITASTNLVGAQILHILAIETPYAGGPTQIQQLRSIQAEINNIILCSTEPPQELQISTPGTLTADPTFTFGPLTLVDGPYLDPQSQSLSMSATSGSGVTLTAGSAVFASTDVGRAVRIFTQPPLYNPSSTYTAGETVTYNPVLAGSNLGLNNSGAWWQATAAVSAGEAPGQATSTGTLVWAPAPTAGSWAWGLITAYTNSTHVTFAFDTTIPGMTLIAANGDTAYEWQLGVYSQTTGYPANGTYFEGRLCLGGCVPNRFDMTTSNGVSQIVGTNTATFSMSDPNGNVLDNSGISEVLNSKGINQIQWMIPDSGILMGTLSGETLVSASTLGDPITPTSIQAHEITRYGSLNIEAKRAGMALIFAQKFGRRLMEYLDDTLSQKFTGRHLNEFAKHLTASGIARIEYQEEPVPIVWALMNNGMLAGCTYRRFNRFVSTPPECSGWHWNMHGAGNVYTSMCVVPGKNGLFDRLFLVTANAPASVGGPVQNYQIEIMQPPFDTSNSIYQGWFVDQSPGPGPGNSGFDCGGGNSSSYFATGGLRGADSTTATTPSQLAAFQNITLGQSPPAGGNLLLKNGATFFPGTVILYNLPKWLTSGSIQDVTKMSISVWLGTEDILNNNQGSLLSSPGLEPSEDASGHTSSSLVTPAGSGFMTAAAMYNGLGDGIDGAEASAEMEGNTGSQQWTHVMISAENSGGDIVVTCAVNDTVVLSSQSFGSIFTGGNGMWPFESEQDAQKTVGLALWCIGGQNVVPPNDLLTIQSSSGPIQTFTVPPLLSIVTSSGNGGRLEIGYGPNGPLLPPGATQQAIYDLIYKGYSYQVNTTLETAAFTGGQSNVPVVDALGSTCGYLGSVAELWIMPGMFVDWTNATNREKFHEYDSISESWGPVPLGVNGQLPFSAAPWIYCSGGPKTFPVNNATGNALTELDTTSGLIDFDTGLSGGLTVSPLSFP
jgi:hypothetical protein